MVRDSGLVHSESFGAILSLPCVVQESSAQNGGCSWSPPEKEKKKKKRQPWEEIENLVTRTCRSEVGRCTGHKPVPNSLFSESGLVLVRRGCRLPDRRVYSFSGEGAGLQVPQR